MHGCGPPATGWSGPRRTCACACLSRLPLPLLLLRLLVPALASLLLQLLALLLVRPLMRALHLPPQLLRQLRPQPYLQIQLLQHLPLQRPRFWQVQEQLQLLHWKTLAPWSLQGLVRAQLQLGLQEARVRL